jgi:hypothetical protein
MFTLKRKLIGAFTATGIFAFYCHKKHLYEKELFDRYNYLIENKVDLSGVFLRQRLPFGKFWLQWVLPYHQSLEIVQKDGSVRHTGLGRPHGGMFDKAAEWVLHKGSNYTILNALDSKIPVEVWVDYKREFGHYPENIDVERLNEITMTREEASKNGSDNFHTTEIGKIMWDLKGRPYVTSCRSAVMDAIRSEEQMRECSGKQDILYQCPISFDDKE